MANVDKEQRFDLMVLPVHARVNSTATNLLSWLEKELKNKYSTKKTSLENRQYSPFVDYDYVVSTPRTYFLSKTKPDKPEVTIVVQSMEQLEAFYNNNTL